MSCLPLIVGELITLVNPHYRAKNEKCSSLVLWVKSDHSKPLFMYANYHMLGETLNSPSIRPNALVPIIRTFSRIVGYKPLF